MRPRPVALTRTAAPSASSRVPFFAAAPGGTAAGAGLAGLSTAGRGGGAEGAGEGACCGTPKPCAPGGRTNVPDGGPLGGRAAGGRTNVPEGGPLAGALGGREAVGIANIPVGGPLLFAAERILST